MSTTLQLLGAGAITAGVILLSVPIGIVVGGAFMVLIGLSVGR
jgi:hypothetical protein